MVHMWIQVCVMQVRSLLPVKELCAEVEKRNKLKLLDKFLKVLVEEGSQDPDVHNAMGKILIDANSNPEHFLQSNPFYQPAVVGKYCEKRCVAFVPEAFCASTCTVVHDKMLFTCKCTEYMGVIALSCPRFLLQARYTTEIAQ